ncbi:hypothetical protein DFH09DRAFT_891803, partial [Mycena vulgaris]
KEFLCGNPRLCPKHLRETPRFAPRLSNYQRLGGLCLSAFLKKWSNNSDYTYSASWQVHTPIADDQVLQCGMLADRFGRVYETFLFPAGMPYFD